MRFLPSLCALLALAACSGSPSPPSAGNPAGEPANVQGGILDEEAKRIADGRAPYEALPDLRTDPASGVRYGVIDGLLRSDDTLETARARLGAPNVVPDTLAGAEGEMVQGWTLYPGHPTRELAVYLDDSGTTPRSIVAGEDVSEWRRADGVMIGMSSQELAALNGRPFDFMGFDWDFGGVVVDWNGGALGGEAHGPHPVRLCAPETPEGMTPPDLPFGDSEFSSDDPRLAATPAWVCEFGINLSS